MLGGLQTDEAREVIASMPTVTDLMPGAEPGRPRRQTLEKPEDIAAQLTTPMTPAQWRRRQILRAIEANPGASDRAIAQIAPCARPELLIAASYGAGNPAIQWGIPDRPNRRAPIMTATLNEDPDLCRVCIAENRDRRRSLRRLSAAV